MTEPNPEPQLINVIQSLTDAKMNGTIDQVTKRQIIDLD